MTTTGGEATYPGSTGATTQLVGPTRSIPPRAITANQRFTHTIFNSPTRTVCLGGACHVTRRTAHRGHGGARLHPSKHIPCQSHRRCACGAMRGRLAGIIPKLHPSAEGRLTRLRVERSPAFHANFTM